MAEYIGDFAAGSIIKLKFNTRTLAQAPITFAGTPQVAVYKDSVTQTTTGVTQPTVDYDGVTGLHYMVIDTSDAFYEAGKDYDIVVTAGTVDGQSVVGETVKTFSIENRSAIRPTTPGRTLDVSSGGAAGIDWANVESPTTALNLSGTIIKDVTDISIGNDVY